MLTPRNVADSQEGRTSATKATGLKAKVRNLSQMIHLRKHSNLLHNVKAEEYGNNWYCKCMPSCMHACNDPVLSTPVCRWQLSRSSFGPERLWAVWFNMQLPSTLVLLKHFNETKQNNADDLQINRHTMADTATQELISTVRCIGSCVGWALFGFGR